MIRTTHILYVMLIAIPLSLSGCIDPGIPDTNNTGLTPMGDDVAPTPTPTPTLPTSGKHYTPTPEPPVETNDTDDDPSTWDVCDPRHNASWLYAHGCLGGGGGGGHRYHRSSVNDPIPELPTVLLVIAGIVGLAAFYWRK